MNVWIRRSLQVGFVAAGMVVAGAAAAHADDAVTYDNYGIGNGNQVVAPIQLPINVCGNALGVLGDAEAGCKGGSTAKLKSDALPDLTSYDNYGLLNGNQVVLPIQAPIDVCGNAVAVAGDATAECEGGSKAVIKSAHKVHKMMAPANGPDAVTYDNYGAGNGNQLIAPIQVPVDVCGNAVGALGDAEAGCEGGSTAHLDASTLPDLTSYDNYGLLNGNQAVVPVQVPVEVSGNAVGVAGDANAWSQGGSEAHIMRAPATKRMSGPDLESSDNFGILNGNQAYIPIQLPINVCGNALGLLGDAEAGCKGGATAKIKHGSGPDLKTWDNYGVLNGNQLYIPIQAPINVCGNALGIAGDAEAGCKGGSHATLKSGSGPDLKTWDNYGIAVGNQIYAPIQAPIDISGNAAGVLGDAMAKSKGGTEAVIH